MNLMKQREEIKDMEVQASRKELEDKVIDIISKYLKQEGFKNIHTINITTTFEELNLDVVDYIEIEMLLEINFNIRMPNEIPSIFEKYIISTTNNDIIDIKGLVNKVELYSNNKIKMKKYIGIKTVDAKPMSKGKAFDNKLTRSISTGESEVEGYKVIYEDGYESWSPKDVFEKTYKPADTFLDRLHIERKDLADKFEKALLFVNSSNFREVIKEDYPAFLLYLQTNAMSSYINCLNNRIEYANGAKQHCNTKFKFEEAIRALKFGLAIRRSGWEDKGMFVVKQIPAHINEDIIPNMQSLPQSAKDIIMARDNKSIDYTNQILIVNSYGRADSWLPSSSDIFAKDWEIIETN